LGGNLQEPILGCGNPTEVFLNVLFSHIADGNLQSSAVHDGHTEHPLGQKNALGMVAKGSVTEVRKECFRLIKPTMNREIVFRLPTELPRAVLCVFEGMGHTYTSYVDVV
jgi:hypothetical protein